MFSSTVFGIHACLAHLESDTLDNSTAKLYVSEQRSNPRIQAALVAAQAKNIPIYEVSKARLSELAKKGVHQGIVLTGVSVQRALQANHDTPAEPETSPHERLTHHLQAPKGEFPFFLILDQVTDPHNLGACLRTAEGAGVDAVIIPKDHSAKITPVVEKVASGAAQRVSLIAVTNLVRTLDTLKEAGVWIIGLEGASEQTIFDMDLKGPIALVMGSEGDGLRRLTKAACDFLAKLPMAGSLSSLNVSVAAGIALYECVRQRSLNL